MLHSPPVYEDPDLDTVDHDFYDYAGVSSVPDDDFYYVSWEDPIYDNFYDYSGKWTTTILSVTGKIIVLQFCFVYFYWVCLHFCLHLLSLFTFFVYFFPRSNLKRLWVSMRLLKASKKNFLVLPTIASPFVTPQLHWNLILIPYVELFWAQMSIAQLLSTAR